MGRRNRRRKGNEETQPRRGSVPGSLEHISGDIDEFQAGIIAGADGEPVEDENIVSEAELEAEAQAALGRPDEVEEAAPVPAGRPSASQPAAGRGGSRAINFLKACWAELQRVQWPDRRQVAQATAVVLGFVVIAGAYLGLADAAAQKVIDFILK